jgi:hypothetical protein
MIAGWPLIKLSTTKPIFQSYINCSKPVGSSKEGVKIIWNRKHHPVSYS